MAVPASKTILITGATSGVGLAGAREMARQGWRVFLHGRSAESCQTAVSSLKTEMPEGQIEGACGDLASAEGIKAIVTSMKDRCPKLDVLWNNAGAMLTKRSLTAEGWEMQMAVNYIAPWRLTMALLPQLLAGGGGRVIGTSSGAQAWGKIDFDNWMDEGNRYSSMGTYSKSKLATVLFARELATRYGSQGLIAQCFHPGFVRTDIGKPRSQGRHNPLFALIFALAIPPQAGADTGVFLATDPAAAQTNGRYWTKRKLHSTNKLDTVENARRLWELTEKAVTL